MIGAFMDLKYHQVTWDEHLNEFQLAYNSSVHDSTKYSPFSVVFGREPRVFAQPDFVQSTSHSTYVSPGDKVLVDFPVQSNSAQGRAAKLVRSARCPFQILKV
ncbi:hypothetical protein G6F31_020765 [Rhizopus arrhizus]|nr:hypothetical protein G6F31_020765 [Rhizopus arrhizus]